MPCISTILVDACQSPVQLTEEASCYQIVFEPGCCQLAAEPSYSQAVEEPSQPPQEARSSSSSSSLSLNVPYHSSNSEQPSQPPQEPTLAHYIDEPSGCCQLEAESYCSHASAEPRALAEQACCESMEEPSCSQAADEACCRVPSQSLWPNIIWRQADRTEHSHLRSAACRTLLALRTAAAAWAWCTATGPAPCPTHARRQQHRLWCRTWLLTSLIVYGVGARCSTCHYGIPRFCDSGGLRRRKVQIRPAAPIVEGPIGMWACLCQLRAWHC